MAERERITPDLPFVRAVQAAGGQAVKKCYQCAACSVACPLAPPESPFPRKEMLWAQWGLRDRLTGDIDLWLCHDCQTCSALCPRGARPGDVLAAARAIVCRDLPAPAWLGRLGSPRGLPWLMAVPAVFYLGVWGLTTGLRVPDGAIVFGRVFPGDWVIDPVFGLLGLFVLATLARGAVRLWRRFRATTPVTLVIGARPDKPTMAASVRAVLLGEVASHAKWIACGSENGERYRGHLSLFYGVLALAVVTALLALGHWGGRIAPPVALLGVTPMPLWHPVKLLANAGAVAMVYGLAVLSRHRLRADPARSRSSAADWLLLGLLWAVALTGLGAEIFRLAGAAVLAYPAYYLHLVAVFTLFASLPWSKLGHAVYRTTALLSAHQVGRLPFGRRDETTLRI